MNVAVSPSSTGESRRLDSSGPLATPPGAFSVRRGGAPSTALTGEYPSRVTLAERDEDPGLVHRIRIFRSSSPRSLVALGLVALCVLLASGRSTSGDGSSQLAQAVHFCVSGRVAATHPIGSEFEGQDFFSRSKSFYDANDVGGTLLMLPAACASALHGARDPATVGQLTTVAKAGASMTFAVVGALGVVFVMLALSELVGLERACWWALAFLFATGFLAYVKGLWDVLPAATAVAMLGWVAVRCLVGRDGPRRTLILAALAVGLAGLCRYTLAPFLIVGAVAAIWPAIRDATIRQRVEGAAVLVLVLMPDFVWNQVRTGAFWKPGQANPAWAYLNPQLTGHYLLSTFGLFFSIRWGLLFFAPICLLGYACVLIYIVRSRGATSTAWVVGLAVAVAYVVTISLVHTWNVFGWGPRYLVPLLPVLFVVVVVAIERGIIPKALGYACVAAGMLTEFPLVFADWNAVAAVVGRDHRAPDEIVGLWRSMLDGIASGRGFGQVMDPRALQVPDVWWWHVVAKHLPHLLGPVLLVAAAAGIVGATVAAARTGDASRLRPSS